jgi:NmrA-like family
MSSFDSLENVIFGAHTVFLVTDFWQHMSRSEEVLQGKNVTDACKVAGVQHLIFSSLIDATEASKTAFVHIYHFDGKAEIERYIRDSGVPATFVLAGTFMTEMHHLINRNGDGYVLALPVDENSQIPLIDIRNDFGQFLFLCSIFLGSRVIPTPVVADCAVHRRSIYQGSHQKPRIATWPQNICIRCILHSTTDHRRFFGINWKARGLPANPQTSIQIIFSGRKSTGDI